MCRFSLIEILWLIFPLRIVQCSSCVASLLSGYASLVPFIIWLFSMLDPVLVLGGVNHCVLFLSCEQLCAYKVVYIMYRDGISQFMDSWLNMEKCECFPFISDLYKHTFLYMRVGYLFFLVQCFVLGIYSHHVSDYIPLHMRESHALFIMQYLAARKWPDCAWCGCLWDLFDSE